MNQELTKREQAQNDAAREEIIREVNQDLADKYQQLANEARDRRLVALQALGMVTILRSMENE